MENLQHRWSNNLRKNLNKLCCATGYWLPCSLFKFFLKFLDQQCWRFSEGYLNNFSTELSSQICDCCPRNFLIQEERIGNVVSTSHWIRPVVILQYDVHTGKVLCIFSGLRSFEERAANGYNVTRQAVPGFNFRKWC